MKRRELTVGQTWIPADVEDKSWEEIPWPMISRKPDSSVSYESWSQPQEGVIIDWRSAMLAMFDELYNAAPHVQKSKGEVDAKVFERLEVLEAKIAALGELEPRVTALEKAPGMASSNEALRPNPLDWILDHPELQQCYSGQYVAIRMGDKFEVIASDKDLGRLLDSLGDNPTEIYFHQFL